jgi:fatty acid/phospholipid biosynthesis enzyme
MKPRNFSTTKPQLILIRKSKKINPLINKISKTQKPSSNFSHDKKIITKTPNILKTIKPIQ